MQNYSSHADPAFFSERSAESNQWPAERPEHILHASELEESPLGVWAEFFLLAESTCLVGNQDLMRQRPALFAARTPLEDGRCFIAYETCSTSDLQFPFDPAVLLRSER
jgi:hypothetical protein